MFRDWPRLLPWFVEPIGVQLPGRAERFTERPLPTDAPLVDRLIVDAGDPNGAAERLGEALDICRETGNQRVEAQALYRLGRAYLDQGRVGDADQVLVSAMRIVRAVGDLAGECYVRMGQSTVRVRRGDVAGAEAVLRDALVTCEEIGDESIEARVRFELGQVLAQRSDVPGARMFLTMARETFQRNKLDLWEQRAYRQLRELDGVNSEVGGH